MRMRKIGSAKYQNIKMARLSYSLESLSSVDASFSSCASSASGGYEIESEIGREALKQICLSALSRVLDFPGSQLETLLDDRGHRDEDGALNVAKNIAASFKMMKRGLSVLSHRCYHKQGLNRQHNKEDADGDENDGFPTLTFGEPISSESQVTLLQLIAYMDAHTAQEGLFRKPGSKTRVESLVRELGERSLEDIVASNTYSAHDFASVLKQFFSDLPEPLMLQRHLDAYIQAAELSSPGLVTRCLQLVTLLLPPAHRIVLQHLLNLLSSTAAACLENKMDANNLALVFAPTLFLPSNPTEPVSPSSLQRLVVLLKHMILNSDDIFEVPTEVQVVADRYLQKKTKTGSDDVALDVYGTFCERTKAGDFHREGQDRAMAEVASLYEYVMKLPDGPQKTHFLKRFEKTGNTPQAHVKQPKSHRNKENCTPRVKLMQGIGSERAKSSSKRGRLFKPKSLDNILSGTPSRHLSSFNPHAATPAKGTTTQVPFLVTQSPMVTEV